MEGIYAPIPTPFVDPDGDIAWDKLEANMAFWTASSLDGIVVMGSNGEFVVLNPAEKVELIKRVCALAKGKKRVMAGCGCESTRDTIALCREAAKAGADAALVLNPNYYKRAMTDAVIAAFYKDVAEASPIPVVLYNMPGNSGVNLSSSLVASLAPHPNIIGVKDSGGNIVQITEIIRDTPADFAVFAGSASFLYPTIALGGVGGTLALANILPEECCRLWQLARGGKHAEASQLQKKLLAANNAVTARWGIAGLKAAMESIGLFGGAPRKPLLSLQDSERAELVKTLDAARR
jgi:Dihydrodipicolinate synthase/N-acetylneuraminate lyase